MQVSNDVLLVLSNALTLGNRLKLTDQLDRPLYERTNKVLKAAGGAWSTRAQAHVFSGDAAEAIEQIVLTGQVTIPQDFGYFPTPAIVVEQLCNVADVRPGMAALEPSAGQGAIACELARRGAYVVAYELLEKNLPSLSKALSEPAATHTVVMRDFLTVPAEPIFDRVVMNPPFGKQADIDHVSRALQFLKPDGLLVSVMAASIMFRQNRKTKEFIELLETRGGEIHHLEPGAFKESGTMVNTVFVAIPGGGV